jgi:hypothetical protein
MKSTSPTGQKGKQMKKTYYVSIWTTIRVEAETEKEAIELGYDAVGCQLKPRDYTIDAEEEEAE